MNQKKRIFIGYFLSEDLKQKILAWRHQFDDLSIRWVTPENLHVTLVPPWYEDDVPSVFSRLQSVAGKFSSLPVSFNSVSFVPDKRKPRLIWAKGETPDDVVRLKTQLTESLQKEKEKRLPLLHVTLARFHKGKLPVSSAKNILSQVDWQDEINVISIIESHLTSSGAVYESLTDIPLSD